MKMTPFALERYYAKHEFSARYMLSSSDCEALSMSELVGMADIETRQLWGELKLGYTETPGHPLLRQEISKLYEHIDTQGILVMAPQEGIFLLMHALLEPGNHVICTAPAYQSLHEVARSIGCQVSSWGGGLISQTTKDFCVTIPSWWWLISHTTRPATYHP